jgi:hypothetical protein
MFAALPKIAITEAVLCVPDRSRSNSPSEVTTGA